MGYIYKITNIQNKMMYIGQTTYELKDRIRHHFDKKSNCRYLNNAIQKYGRNNFKVEIICICFDDDLNRFEEDYIKRYNTLVYFKNCIYKRSSSKFLSKSTFYSCSTFNENLLSLLTILTKFTCSL